MKVAYITAGAGGMYCGSCLHDNTLAAAMQRLGHEVTLIPTYTPLRTDETDVSIDKVFYGAINVYLEQKSALFRHTPWLVDRMLNAPRLLNWVSRKASSTDARELGALTLSVLQGKDGNQKKELDKLVRWLQEEVRPEVVHLTNSMLLGLARPLSEALRAPVLCSVQGEDIFLDELAEPHRSRVRDALRQRAHDVDGFIATSRYYAKRMGELLQVSPARMAVVELGLNLRGHGVEVRAKDERPFMIGYLARICPEKGLHVLAEAFHRLAERTGKDQVRLRVAGYVGERDRAYLEGILGQIRAWGLDDVVDHLGEVDRSAKIELLNSVHVLSVPTTYREPKGLYVLEALANGVPVVQPRHGAFPEMLEALGGGILVEAGSASELMDALYGLMMNRERREELGRQGKQAVHASRSDERMAQATLELYARHVGASKARSAVG